MFKYILLLLFTSNVCLIAQSFTFKGQLLLNSLYYEYNEDVKKNNQISYTPSLSFKSEIDSDSFLDFEISYQLTRRYTSKIQTDKHKYRFWGRYANETLNVRLGLQKISFGQAFIFRPLSWFDTIDYRNTTDQTIGVKALRLKYTPNNSYGIWAWIMKSNQKVPSYGFRLELSDKSGDWGVSYHRDSEDNAHFPNQLTNIIHNSGLILINGGFRENDRLGFDYRFDGNIGFWIEASSYIMDNNKVVYVPSLLKRIDLATFGFDYTIPTSTNSILFLSETLYSYFLSEDNDFIDRTSTAFNLNFTIDIMNELMFITILDWEDEKFYNYLRWSNRYDYFNVDFMLSLNPEVIGNNFQIMFVYNH